MPVLLPDRYNPVPYKFQLFARSGWEIPVFEPQEDPNFPANAKDQNERFLRRFGATIALRSAPVWPYNCAGLVFALRRIEVRDQYIDDILREDGYREIERKDAREGDLVVYRYMGKSSHVGIIFLIDNHSYSIPTIKILSKWGDAGEFIHLLDSVPEIYGKSFFYTDRQYDY